MKISRRLLLAALALLAAPLPAFALTPQDEKDVARVETYLNGIVTLKARFLQIAPSGASSSGRLWMERPGRMRFEYDPPSPLLLVAGQGLVVYHNSNLDQTSNIPLAKTPLGILLQVPLKLSGDVTVQSVNRDEGAIALVLSRVGAEDQGTLTLLFADNPLELRGWILHDAQGQETRIVLDNLDFANTGFNDAMFTYVDPKLFQNNDNTP
jgi:outer membrane lipoprotein-sorting protein